MFLEISQNSQENTCVRVSFLKKLQAFIKKETLAQVFSCEFCKISKNTFSHRTPPVAASGRIVLDILRNFTVTSTVKLVLSIVVDCEHGTFSIIPDVFLKYPQILTTQKQLSRGVLQNLLFCKICCFAKGCNVI